MKTKTLTLIALITVSICMLISCKGQTYSKQIKREKKKIENYISREGIRVLRNAPDVKNGERWGEKDYIALDGYDYLYYHLTSPVDSTATPLVAGDRINIRYRKYGLDAYTDTISYWTTDDGGDPITLVLGDATATNSCPAWHLAILEMGRSGYECRIICPSTAGFTNDNASVTPYVYDLKVTKRP
ncbi:MAG: DUF4827 family protein [Paludibacteraceae bacterium]|nr:DUF4827 family protein [Paludibacteraceae bacterium]